MLWGLAVIELLLQLGGKHFFIICETLLLIQNQKLSLLFFLTVPLAFLLWLAIRVFVVSHHQQIPLQSLFLSRVEVGIRHLLLAWVWLIKPLVFGCDYIRHSCLSLQSCTLVGLRSLSEKFLLDCVLGQRIGEDRGSDSFDVAFALTTSVLNLLLIELHVGFLKFSHLFDFIQVDHEAFFQMMEVFDAFSAENAGMLRAIKMLNSLVMFLAKVR